LDASPNSIFFNFLHTNIRTGDVCVSYSRPAYKISFTNTPKISCIVIESDVCK
jgi:hypothetical protein